MKIISDRQCLSLNPRENSVKISITIILIKITQTLTPKRNPLGQPGISKLAYGTAHRKSECDSTQSAVARLGRGCPGCRETQSHTKRCAVHPELFRWKLNPSAPWYQKPLARWTADTLRAIEDAGFPTEVWPEQTAKAIEVTTRPIPPALNSSNSFTRSQCESPTPYPSNDCSWLFS